MNLSELLASKTDGRLGYTTTVKDQVDSIQVNCDINEVQYVALQKSDVRPKKGARIDSVRN